MKKVTTICIIAMPHGNREGRFICRSNSAIAKLTSCFSEIHDLPVLAGSEVFRAAAYLKLPTDAWELLPGGDSLSSIELLEHAKRIMTTKGFTDVVLMGHPQHIETVRAMLHQFDIQESFMQPPEMRVFHDRRSSMFWTRNTVWYGLYQFLEASLFWKGTVLGFLGNHPAGTEAQKR